MTSIPREVPNGPAAPTTPSACAEGCGDTSCLSRGTGPAWGAQSRKWRSGPAPLPWLESRGLQATVSSSPTVSCLWPPGTSSPQLCACRRTALAPSKRAGSRPTPSPQGFPGHSQARKVMGSVTGSAPVNGPEPGLRTQRSGQLRLRSPGTHANTSHPLRAPGGIVGEIFEVHLRGYSTTHW